VSRLLTRGHTAAIAAVETMIAGPTPHAIVITGPPGVGKKTLALDLAAGLLCDAEDPASRPCRECRGCRLVDAGGHADLHRIAPAGAGNQIRIGARSEPEAGTVRRLIADLSLMPVEGGARVALIEEADRMNEEAESALLKTLEEPPAGVTIILCVDRAEQLLPTVLSRCVRLRLGPVAVRDIEAILAEQGVADAPTAARLARISSGRPGLARAWALAPEAVLARAEIGRSLLDLAVEGPARRLSVGRELLARAADVVRTLDRSNPTDSATSPKRPKRGARSVGPAAETAPPAPTSGDGGEGDAPPEGDATEADGTRDVRAPAADRRRAAATLVAIWRDLARDLALIGLGEERGLRDPGLVDDLRAAAGPPSPAIAAFIARLDRAAELIDANVSPELAIDVLLLAWPQRPRAA
jgi:DNA polymerase III delta' subunit